MTFSKGRLRKPFLRVEVQHGPEKPQGIPPGTVKGIMVQAGSITGNNVQNGSITHSQLGGVTSDQHHPKNHTHSEYGRPLVVPSEPHFGDY